MRVKISCASCKHTDDGERRTSAVRKDEKEEELGGEKDRQRRREREVAGTEKDYGKAKRWFILISTFLRTVT